MRRQTADAGAGARAGPASAEERGRLRPPGPTEADRTTPASGRLHVRPTGASGRAAGRAERTRRSQPSPAVRGRPRPAGPRPRAAKTVTGRAGGGKAVAPSPVASSERRPRRFNPGRAHRQAVMASLPPEQQPIAEQVLRGGIPAVRTALHLEREKAVAEGRPAPNTDQLIAMAESLLPRLKAAEWRDRAEAAVKEVDEISLRDLRSVVAGADSGARRRGPGPGRQPCARLSSGGWTGCAGNGPKRSANIWTRAEWCGPCAWPARPPEPAARMDPELTQRLSDAAGEAMGPDTPPDRWLALIDAVAASPIRRSVKPAGLPADPTPELRRAAHQQSGRIPALAAMLGMAIPPPPPPIPGRRSPGASPKGSRPPAGPSDAEASAVGAQDTVVVEELGEALSEG